MRQQRGLINCLAILLMQSECYDTLIDYVLFILCARPRNEFLMIFSRHYFCFVMKSTIEEDDE